MTPVISSAARSARATAVAGLLVLALAPAISSRPATAASLPTLEALAEASAKEVDTRVLRRLPSLVRSTRLTGETDGLVWPVWLTAGEAERGTRLRLAHVSAVSVMPEASRLTVAVNDRVVSDAAIASGGNRVTELALPAGVLKPGWNAIRVGVDQRHRVDCSVASTWELWTDIDRARSGLVFPTGHHPDRRGIADIAGIAPDEHGRVAIRIVTGGDAEARQMERAVRAAEALALIGGFLDPVVTVTRRPEKAPGIDLVIGRATAALEGDATGLQAGTIAVLDHGEPDRLAVVLPGDEVAVERAVAQLADMAGQASEGSEAGLEARAGVGGRAVASGERLGLADVGATSREFSGRLFRVGFDLRLPADLYAADYAKVQLKLAGGHAPGLDRTSRITVRVNGRQAAGVPIVAPRGEIFTDKSLQIPLSAFRPGHNRVEIEAAAVMAADQTCDPAVQIDGPKRFLFVDRSELVFPSFARLTRLPDLAATAAGVLARLPVETQPVLHVPRADPAALSAAATLAVRMAVAGGRIDAPRFAFRAPAADAPSAIVVGAMPDLPATVIGAVGLEGGRMRAAWGRRPAEEVAAASRTTADVLVRRASSLRVAGLGGAPVPGDVDPITTGSIQGRVLTTPPPSDADLVARWKRSMESPWSPVAFSRQMGGHFEKLFDFLPRSGEARPLDGVATTASTGLVVAQAMSAAGGAWTLVAAPSSSMLSDAVTAVTAGETWTRLDGAAATWDLVEEAVTTVPAARVGFLATSGFDFTNLRLVGAALVSDHPWSGILAAFLVTTCLGFTTARLLPRLGRSRR